MISLRAGWHAMFSDLSRLLLYLGEASLSPERKLIIRNQLLFVHAPPSASGVVFLCFASASNA